MGCAISVCVLEGCSELVPPSLSPALGCYCCLAVGGQRASCAHVADLIGVEIGRPTPLQVLALLEDLQEAFSLKGMRMSSVQAGFKLTRVVQTRSIFSIVEAKPMPRSSTASQPSTSIGNVQAAGAV